MWLYIIICLIAYFLNKLILIIKKDIENDLIII
jgi:hypothetical protein